MLKGIETELSLRDSQLPPRGKMACVAAIAAILSMTGCEDTPTGFCNPVWLPENAKVWIDGKSWENAECKEIGAILWNFMDKPNKLWYLGSDVQGTIKSIKQLYKILDSIDRDKPTLGDIQEALKIIDILIQNNIREDALDSRKIREEVYAYGRDLWKIKAWLEKIRDTFFEK